MQIHTEINYIFNNNIYLPMFHYDDNHIEFFYIA